MRSGWFGFGLRGWVSMGIGGYGWDNLVSGMLGSGDGPVSGLLAWLVQPGNWLEVGLVGMDFYWTNACEEIILASEKLYV